MRIGFVVGEYPPMEGGVGAFTQALARDLSKQGHTIGIFTRKQAKLSSGDHFNLYTYADTTWGWGTFPHLANWSQAFRPDVINIQYQAAQYDMHPAIFTTPFWLNRQLPVVVTFHDLRVPYLFPKAGVIRHLAVKFLAACAEAVIATEQSDANILRDDWKIADVDWIPIGSNVGTLLPTGFQANQWREQFGIKQSDMLISYFGFLNESKGALVLMQALKYLIQLGVPAQVVMIGAQIGASDLTNRKYEERVLQFIRDNHLENCVHWTGFLPDEYVSAWFNVSDVTALPYLDGVSLRRGTLMAALANGCAIVSTVSDSLPPELQSSIATVPVQDYAALARKIHDIWQTPKEQQRLKNASRNISRSFSWPQIGEQTIRVFQRVSMGRSVIQT